MREKISWGLLILVVFGFGWFYADSKSTVSELEAELVRSHRLSGQIREQNQELSLRQQQLEIDLERANHRVVELRERAERAEVIVERTSRDLAQAVNESRELGELLRGIFDVIEQLELATQAP